MTMITTQQGPPGPAPSPKRSSLMQTPVVDAKIADFARASRDLATSPTPENAEKVCMACRVAWAYLFDAWLVFAGYEAGTLDDFRGAFDRSIEAMGSSDLQANDRVQGYAQNVRRRKDLFDALLRGDMRYIHERLNAELRAQQEKEALSAK